MRETQYNKERACLLQFWKEIAIWKNSPKQYYAFHEYNGETVIVIVNRESEYIFDGPGYYLCKELPETGFSQLKEIKVPGFEQRLKVFAIKALYKISGPTSSSGCNMLVIDIPERLTTNAFRDKEEMIIEGVKEYNLVLLRNPEKGIYEIYSWDKEALHRIAGLAELMFFSCKKDDNYYHVDKDLGGKNHGRVTIVAPETVEMIQAICFFAAHSLKERAESGVEMQDYVYHSIKKNIKTKEDLNKLLDLMS